MAMDAETTGRPRARVRMPAEERRRLIVAAAVDAFAAGGLHGTATEDVARRAGVSQPYVFRLFGTKRDLFLAAVAELFDRVEDLFRAAAERAAAGRELDAMGDAYAAMLQAEPRLLLLQMQAYAACGDPVVQTEVRRRFGGLYRLVEDLTHADEETVRRFFAAGMLLNVAAAIDLESPGEDWCRRVLGGAPLR